MQLQLPRNRRLDLSRTKLMGILNVTPDSFSDGGQFIGQAAALRTGATNVGKWRRYY